MKSITAKRAPAAGRSQGLCRAGTEWRRGLLSGADRRGSCPAQVDWEDVVRRSPQSLILSSPSTTSSGSKAPTADRTWCAPPRNPLFLRRRAPRLPGPRRRRRSGRGAPRPAIPYSFVAGYHVFRIQGASGGPDVVRPDPQSLIPSSPGTTSSGAKAPTATGRNGPETWCKGNGRTRLCGVSCTKSPPAPRRKWPETWCKGNGGTRLCGVSCTKSPPATGRNGPETWCKGNGGARLCGNSCTKSPPAKAPGDSVFSFLIL